MLIRRVPGAVGSRAASNYNGSTQYAFLSSTDLPAPAPLTLVAWCRPDNATAVHTAIALADTASTTNYVALQFRGADVNDPVAAVSRGTTYRAATAGTFVAGRWHHGAAVYASATSRTAYLDGVAGTEDTTSASPTSIDMLTLGNLRRTTEFADTLAGALTSPAIYTAALSASDIGRLARGAHPTTVRPDALWECWDLDRVGPLRGLVRGTMLSPVGGGGLTIGPSWVQGPNRVYRMPIGDVFGGTTNYTLTADAGAATVTGTTATTLYQRVVQAASDTVTATGTAATALYNRVVAALSTAWALTGQTAGAFYQRVVSALSSAVDVTTTTATTLWHRVTGAQTASVDVTGTTATLTYSGDTGPTPEQRKKQFLLMGVMKALLLALWSDYV